MGALLEALLRIDADPADPASLHDDFNLWRLARISGSRGGFLQRNRLHGQR
jgi:hypothetical protein